MSAFGCFAQKQKTRKTIEFSALLCDIVCDRLYRRWAKKNNLLQTFSP